MGDMKTKLSEAEKAKEKYYKVVHIPPIPVSTNF